MDLEIFGILILVVIYIVMTISGIGKKKKKPEKKNAIPTEAFKQEKTEEPVFQDPCDEEEAPSLHLHQVTEEELEAAEEGEDPCHAGGVITAVRAEKQNEPEEANETANLDVINGIIMSEILVRPAERKALRQIRRGKKRE